MPRYLSYLFSLAVKQRRRFVALVALLLLSVSVRLLEPYLYKVVVDTLADGLIAGRFIPAQLEVLGYVVAAWFVLAVIVNITSAHVQYMAWQIGNRSSQEVHITGYRRLLRLDYAQHLKRHSSKYTKIVDNADVGIWEMTQWWLARFASAGLGFIGMLIIAITVSWQMTLIAFAVIPPGLWFIIRYVKRCEVEQRRVNKMWEEKHEHLSDQIANVVTYKLNPHERLFVARQWTYSKRAYMAQSNLNKKWRFVESLNPDVFARFLVLGSGIFFVRDGTITLGTLFMFMGLLNEILTPLHVLGDILPQYSRRAQELERFLTLLNQRDAIVVPIEPRRPSTIRGAVAFERVWFWYGQKTRRAFALTDVSFTIEPGRTMALVGHSGSGKTTITTLLNRLFDPTQGRVTIDGVDLRAYDLEELKRSIGTVMQENAMYNESVADNIRYGNPRAARAAVMRAAKEAQAHDFIAKLPKGYDTLIGERGVRLSGGEKQRLAIARAIVKEPRIVILDEPTSALDSMTEAEVQHGLKALAKGRTTLIIAHRLSTVRYADQIIVLAHGRIVDRGTHTDLIKHCHDYRRMVDLQIGGFLADA